jgi:DMSO reductase family type II enzyme heme b subunit
MNARLACAPLLALAACDRGALPPAPTEVAALPCERLPERPDDPAWNEPRDYEAALLPQDLVEPRQLERTTPLVRVRALSDGRRVAFRLEWDDATRDDEQRPAAFGDACAVQLPLEAATDVPAPQMGEVGKAVAIVHWRAAWQATVDAGGRRELTDLYPNASVDHYPGERAGGSEAATSEMARRYSPALALGNPVAAERTSPVEALLASGPGTLAPLESGDASGAGAWTGSGWAVVIACPLPRGIERFGRTQAAFAVWDGARDEAGARKMRTAWVPLALEVRP